VERGGGDEEDQLGTWKARNKGRPTKKSSKGKIKPRCNTEKARSSLDATRKRQEKRRPPTKRKAKEKKDKIHPRSHTEKARKDKISD
jgi:hypothetical protein